MKTNHREIYQSMVNSLNAIDLQPSPERDAAAKAFMICLQHWSRLQACVMSEGYDSLEYEIYFFKRVKPLFTGRIEYFTKIFQSLAFIPPDPVGWPAYWAKEAGRLAQFYDQHTAFVEYFRKGYTHHDEEYFVRSVDAEVPVVWRTPYDSSAFLSSTHDGLVAQLWAHERFHEFATIRLKSISLVHI